MGAIIRQRGWGLGVEGGRLGEGRLGAAIARYHSPYPPRLILEIPMFATDFTRSLEPDEYLALERRAETKSEYFDGLVVAMSGASMNHNRIVRNLLVALAPSLLPRGCDIVGSDLRVRAETLLSERK